MPPIPCGRFFGSFKDEHASSSGSEDSPKKPPSTATQTGAPEKDADVKADGEGAKSKKRVFRKPAFLTRNKKKADGSPKGGKKAAAGGTLQLAPYLVPIKVTITSDGNTVVQDALALRCDKVKLGDVGVEQGNNLCSSSPPRGASRALARNEES